MKSAVTTSIRLCLFSLVLSILGAGTMFGQCVDQTNPEITGCAADRTIAADAACREFLPDLTSDVTATDDCDTTTLAITQSPAQGTTLNLGDLVVTLTATDDEGNTDACEVTITLEDQTAPGFISCSSDQPVSANGICQGQIPNLLPGVSATDNCDTTIPITQSPAGGTVVGLGSVTVVFTAVDDAGHSATCTVTVTIEDDMAPVITGCAAGQNLDADANCERIVPDLTGAVSFNENCNATTTQAPTAGSAIGLGDTVVILTVTDDAGNTDTCTAVITVADGTDPEIVSCPDSTHSADENCEFMLPDLSGDLTVTDNCDDNLSITQSPAIGTTVGLGNTIVTLTATDDAGHTDVCTLTITVEDATPPGITACSPGRTVAADGNCEGMLPNLTTAVSTTDNCDTNVVVTQAPVAGTTIGTQGAVVVLTATDNAGNSSTCAATVTLVDTTSPEILSCASGQTVASDQSCQGIVPDLTGDVSATDNCDNPIVTQAPTATGSFASPNVIVVLTASDGSGNTATCTAVITVVDTIPPEITSCAANQTVATDQNCDGTVPDFTSDVSATDNCDTPIITQNPVVGTAFAFPTQVVTITVTDLAGGSDTCTAIVTAVDTSAPQIVTCAPAQTVAADENCEGSVPNLTSQVSATDNCNVTVSQDMDAGTLIPLGDTVVNITASDDAGNSVTCSVTVTVRDATDPEITSCPDFSDSADENCEYMIPDLSSSITVTDNCDPDLTITQSPAIGTTVGLGDTVVTLKATDDAGLMDICTLVITVEDTTPPQFTDCDAAMTVSANSTCQQTVPSLIGDVAAIDNCDTDVSLSQAPDVGEVIELGVTIVVITATDNAGNSATCTSTVTVIDDTDPVIISCDANRDLAADPNCEQTVPDLTDDVSATDNCDTDVAITQNMADGTIIGLGNTVVVLIATDNTGNTDTCTATISVTDQTDPVIVSCDLDTTLAADAACSQAVPNLASLASATDNCDNDVALTQNPTAGVTIGLGVTTVVITATDNAGNTATCTAVVTVTDETDPVIVRCDADHTLAADANCETTVPVLIGTVSATDNCDTSVSISQSPMSGSTLSLGATMIVFTATDNAGNTDTCTATVTVLDTTNPNITSCAAAQTVSADANCQAHVPDLTPEIDANDNCDESVSVSQSPAAGTTLELGATVIVITVSDDAGNTDTCTAVVTVLDIEDPVIISCDAGTTLSADANCQQAVPTLTGDVTATDNCDTDVAITQVPASGFGINLGATTVILTATDNAGNTDSCTAVITVIDTTDPVITSCEADRNLSANANCEQTVPSLTGDVTATDNCDTAVSISQAPVAGTLMMLGDTVVVFTAVDNAGNTATCTAVVSVTDDADPEIVSCNIDTTLSANQACEQTIPNLASLVSATDNCDTSVAISQSPAVGNPIGLGITVIHITASDNVGNTDACTGTVTVIDTTDPEIVQCDADTTLAANGTCTATLPDLRDGVSATDNCDTDVEIAQVPASGSVLQLGATIVVFTATDNAGHTDTCTGTVTVHDVTNPEITNCEVSTTLSADGNCEQLLPDLTDDISVSDNCDTAVDVMQEPPANTTIGLGDTVVTLKATDNAGNMDICTAIVTVVDVTPPAILACNVTTTLSANELCAQITPDLSAGVTANDNCDTDVEITQIPAVNATLPLGVTPVTITATDNVGNTSTCSGSITVIDTTDPVIIACAVATTLSANQACGESLPDLTSQVSATDNCDTTTTIQSPAAQSGIGLGATTVVLTVTDDAGNSTTCSATVTVVDTTDPQILACALNRTLSADAGCEAQAPNLTPEISATDNCDSDLSVTQDPIAGSSLQLGATVIVVTVTDDAGNTDTCTAVVNVLDVTNPEIVSCDAGLTLSANANCEQFVPSLIGDVSATDNCDTDVVVTQIPAMNTPAPLGVTVVQLTATDNAGNTDSCTAIVTVIDTTDPVITSCEADRSLSADANCEQTVPSLTGDITATDNCDTAVSITQAPVAGTLIMLGDTVVVFTAVDNAGNTTTCTGVVSVVDDSDPVIVSCNIDMTLSADEACAQTVPDLRPLVSATDNCDTSVALSQSPAAGSSIGLGVVVIHITVTDNVGNTDACSGTVRVLDTTDPEIVQCDAAITLAADGACKETVPDLRDGVSATDNCDTDVVITQLLAAGAEIPLGVTVVVFTATDNAANTSTCTGTITVLDVTDPVIAVCPADFTLAADGMCQNTVPTLIGDVSATDNCDTELAVTQEPVAGSSLDLGATVITITVTDNAGNASTCTLTATVLDVTDPVISECAADRTLAADQNCLAQIPDMTGEVTVTDNCDADVTVTQTPSPGTSRGLGDTIVTLTATDDGGNTATCSAVVTIEDQTPPEITVCADAGTLSADANCDVAVPDMAAQTSASDNCDTEVSISQDPTAGSLITLGVTSVVLTAVDNVGNSTTCTATLTVLDDTVPIISSCAAGRTLAADADCENIAPDLTGDVTAGDNCDTDPAVTQAPLAGTSISLGANVITLTVTDDAGNTTSCTATVQVFDVTDPVIASCASNLTLAASAVCMAPVPDMTGDITANDNCDTALALTQEPVAGDSVGLGSSIVVVTATDNAGNTSTCTAVITVIDLADPEITTCAGNVTLAADENCLASLPDLTGGVDATDNCDQSPAISQSPASGTIINLGANTVVLTATDNAGNSSSCTAVATVIDTTSPIIGLCATNATLAVDENCEAMLPDLTTDVDADDNCDASLTVSQSPAAGTTVGVESVTIVITVSDDVGNSATCTATIDALELTNPEIVVCPADRTIVADASCRALIPDLTGEVQATDNCDTGGQIVIMQLTTPGTSKTVGEHIVTLKATDSAGNMDTCTVVVAIVDVTDPEITTCAGDQTLNVDGACSAVVPDLTGAVVGTDNCDTQLGVSQDPEGGSTVTKGIHTVTFTVTDDFGNTDTCTATLTVLDFIDPEIVVCADNRVLAADENCERLVPDLTGEVQVTDNCPMIQVTQIPQPGTKWDLGEHIVTLKATDMSGNMDTCVVTVTVEDQTNPVIADCVNDTRIEAVDGCSVILPDFRIQVMATDNCTSADNLVVTQAPIEGTILTVGTHPLTIVVADVAGNQSSCVATIRVVDLNAPEIVACAGDQTLTVSDSCETTIPDLTGSISATDDCDTTSLLSVTQSPAAGTSVTLGDHQVVITVTDTSGNPSSCSATVTVRDGGAPQVIACASDVTLIADGSCGNIAPDLTADVQAIDNCDPTQDLIVSQDPISGTSLSLGAHAIVLTVSDTAGNQSDCTATAFVVDRTSPSIVTCPASRIVETTSCEGPLPNLVPDVVAEDNCDTAGDIAIAQSTAAGTSLPLGAHVIQLTAEDSAGNVATCETTVTIVDTVDPEIVFCPADRTIAVDANCEAVMPDLAGAASASDNCDSDATLAITQNLVADALLSLGQHNVTLTVVDSSGNSGSCTVLVDVEDHTAPTILTCATGVALNADENCSALVPDMTSGVTAQDNCDTNVAVSQSPAGGAAVSLGDHVVVLTATDNSGNSVTCTAVVSVADVAAPTISSCSASTTLSAGASCTATIGDLTGEIDVADNCTSVPTVTQSPASGTVLALGPHTISFTASDDTGNVSSCSITVTVVDDTAPVVSGCPASTTVSADAFCEWVVDDIASALSISDNCDGSPAVVQTPPAATVVGLGAQAISVTVTDSNGNASVCDVTITVLDTTPPSFSVVPADRTIVADSSNVGTVPDLTAEAAADDNCDSDVQITQSPAADSTTGLGMQNVVVIATDDSGNTTSVTVVVLVNGPPVAAAQAYATVENTPLSGNVITDDTGSGVASDPDSDVLTITAINGVTLSPGAVITLSSGAELTVQSDGSFTYNPNGAFDGLKGGETATDTFTFTISDGKGASSTADVTMTIDGANVSNSWYPTIEYAPIFNASKNRNFRWYNFQIFEVDGDGMVVDVNDPVFETDVQGTVVRPQTYFTVAFDGLLPGNYRFRYRSWNPVTDVFGTFIPADINMPGSGDFDVEVVYDPGSFVNDMVEDLGNGQFQLTFTSVSGRFYQAQVVDDADESIVVPIEQFFVPGPVGDIPVNNDVTLDFEITTAGTYRFELRVLNPSDEDMTPLPDFIEVSGSPVTLDMDETATTPNQPIPLNPVNGDVIPVDGLEGSRLLWTPVPGATSYILFLASTTEGVLVNYVDVGNVTSVDIAALLESINPGSTAMGVLQPGSYIWQVIAVNSNASMTDAFSDWSELVAFDVVGEFLPPTVLGARIDTSDTSGSTLIVDFVEDGVPTELVHIAHDPVGDGVNVFTPILPAQSYDEGTGTVTFSSVSFAVGDRIKIFGEGTDEVTGEPVFGSVKVFTLMNDN